MAREVVVPNIVYTKDMRGVPGRDGPHISKGNGGTLGRDTVGRLYPLGGRVQAGGKTISHEGPWERYNPSNPDHAPKKY